MMLKVNKRLMRPVGRAIADFDMLREHDRVLLGVSGGKDSLSLLHILRQLQHHAPIRFELAAITVDPMVEGFDPSPLQPYVEALEIPCFYRREPILERAAAHMDGNSYCSWCARMKRGVMYATARQEGYNVLALAQHLDDLAESFLMSAFHGGRLKTMKAHYRISAGDLRVVRPLVYTRERQTRDFAASAGLPVISDNCPACFSMPTQRQHMKALLADEEQRNPRLFKSLLATLRPLMSIENADTDLFSH
ncbi:MAG: tRNA 2-thiocytidine biosynthesis protein TtcA [Thiogranum sp.]|jgi:tRNA 2-thiocytidine biosynthesis protein TtcA|nr:tRNA 2-thiocytidine biosynthesis protein TtcA [Thiogranum sp.]